MTRVVVPVRPDFEYHVDYFCRTGTIWSGELPPLIGDPDFLSVNVWPAPSARGLNILPSSLRQRIRPRSLLPAKMEMRATCSS
jgi:hypothetical protein